MSAKGLGTPQGSVWLGHRPMIPANASSLLRRQERLCGRSKQVVSKPTPPDHGFQALGCHFPRPHLATIERWA